MQIGHYVGALLYFGYMFVISYTFALLTGAIGFSATFYFTDNVWRRSSPIVQGVNDSVQHCTEAGDDAALSS
ncbi:TMN7 [Symbiodinium sp. CCMP2592]|nr:TMN7 [Symbiodinium sp. CCMP2592]